MSEIKQSTQSFDWEIFHPREIHELEVSKQYQIEITNRFAALGLLSDDEDIKRALENIKENIKTLAKDSTCQHNLKQHEPWFYEECLGFLIKRSRLKCTGCRIQAKAT